MSSQLPYWLAALHLSGIGPLRWKRLLTHFTDIQKLFTASREELHAAGMNVNEVALLQHPDWQSVEADLAWAEKDGHHLLSFDHEHYPALLREIADPPLVLFVSGNQAALATKQIAIVGSRHATPSGLRSAHQFAHCLAQTGLTITSGLALGIDGASHRGALLAKGLTIAVCGTGLHHIYPRAHESLVADIIHQQGAIVSEFPLATPPKATNFPRRNRIIGGLSIGVLVVEAALKSGSLITARHALEQGREVFAIPGSIHNPLTKGCHHLIRQGAKLVETANDITEELGAFATTYRETSPSVSLSVKEEGLVSCLPLLDQIDYETTPLDLILLRSGLTMSQVSSILLTLELHGYIQSVPGGYVRAA